MPPFLQARRAGPSPRAGVMSTFALGPMRVRRSGYGAMQLSGPFGPFALSVRSRPRSRRSAHGIAGLG